jgi:hypothetical protein
VVQPPPSDSITPLNDYTLTLTSSFPFGHAPIFNSTFSYPPPTIQVDPGKTLPSNPSTQIVHVPIAMTVDPALAGDTTVTLYEDLNNDPNDRHGTIARTSATTLASRLPYAQVLADGGIDWYLANDLPTEHFLYAVIDDGKNTPVVSNYTVAVTPQIAFRGSVTEPGSSPAPLPGLLVYLDVQNKGHFVAGDPQAITDSQGNYYSLRANIPPGSFPLGVVVPNGSQFDSNDTDDPNANPVGSYPGTSPGPNFRLTLLATVSGTIFLDLDHNGDYNPTDDPGAAGQTVFLDVNRDGRRSPGDPATTTDANGHYTLYGVPSSDTPYTFFVVPAANCYTTYQNDGTVLVPDSTSQVQARNIPVQAFTTISGTVTGTTTSSQGQSQAGSQGLANMTVNLQLDGKTVATTLTDSQGNYSFTGLKPGNYTVQEVPTGGWRQVSPYVPNVSFQPGAVFDSIDPVTATYDDSDGDGYVDVAVGFNDPSMPWVEVYFGNGTGNLVNFAGYTYPIHSPATSQIVAYDALGNHKLDLGVIDLFGNISLLLNQGTGRAGLFSLDPGTYPLERSDHGLTAGDFGMAAVGDINGDGRDDLAVTYHGTIAGVKAGVWALLLSDPQGHPQFGDLWPYGTEAGGIALGDLNGDGTLDMVVSGGFPGTTADFTIFYQTVAPNWYQTAYPQGLANLTSAGPVALADINGDGQLDVIVSASPRTSSVEITRYSLQFGAGTFAVGPVLQPYPTRASPRINSLVLNTFQGESVPDLAMPLIQNTEPPNPSLRSSSRSRSRPCPMMFCTCKPCTRTSSTARRTRSAWIRGYGNWIQECFATSWPRASGSPPSIAACKWTSLTRPI